MENSKLANYTQTNVLRSKLTSPNRSHPFLYFVVSHSMLDKSAMTFELVSSVFRPPSSAKHSIHRRRHLTPFRQLCCEFPYKFSFECSSRRIFYGIVRNRLFSRNKCQLSSSFCHFSPPENGKHINQHRIDSDCGCRILRNRKNESFTRTPTCLNN